MSEIKIELMCNGQKKAMGIDTAAPVFTWKVISSSNAGKQKKVRILIAASQEEIQSGNNLLWQYETESESMEVVYKGKALQSRTCYWWKVYLYSTAGKVIESSIDTFETGFLTSECWKSKWIKVSEKPLKRDFPISGQDKKKEQVALEKITLGSVYQVRKEFQVRKEVKRARAYITAHGVYLAMLDGKRVGKYELTPGHTDYNNQLFYQIYDVTENLSEGTHTIGAYVADGWYRSRIGFSGENCQFGTELALLLQLEMEYTDGQREVVCSDESFKVASGAYEYSDLMVGEKYNAQKELIGFFENSYDDSMLRHAEIIEEPYENLIAQTSDNIEIIELISPVSSYEIGEDELLLDFGKTVAGRVRICVNEVAGQEIRIEHSEVEGPDHKFEKNIITPYRNQTDIYICKGCYNEIYEPKFTYHGFRYVKITGINHKMSTKNYQAVVIASKLETTGCFNCSDERLNRLQQNIFRSQLSNMISIPTDCPQREKAGWTGDVQVYAATACFNQNAKEFFRRWLNDVRYEQSEDGQIPIIVPFVEGHKRRFPSAGSSAGWSDVIIILPWVLYQYYGDKTVLEENFTAMERWVSYIRHTAATENPEELKDISAERAAKLKYIWNTGFHFGDWLTPSVSINLETGLVDMMQSAIMTRDIVPTFFYAYSCKILAKISTELGIREKQEYYEKLYERIKEAFQYEYLDNTYTIKSELQGIHVLALQTGLVDGPAREKTVQKLITLIQKNGNKLDTGFLSVPYLLDVLGNAGYRDLAYKILYNEECPSWLYEVKMGATSVWESWQAILPNGRFSCLSMAHYAFGCVGDWMYRNIVGIQRLQPGYKRIRFSPDFNSGLKYAQGSYESIYGKVYCRWEKKDNKITMNIMVPFNTDAQVLIDKVNIKEVWKNGVLATEEYQACSCGEGIDVAPGKYKFIFE